MKFIHLRAFYRIFAYVHNARCWRLTDIGRCIDIPLLRNRRLIILISKPASYDFILKIVESKNTPSPRTKLCKQSIWAATGLD